MARCENCGCGMSGGFCSNCHEEVFIAEQYSELGEDVPTSIQQKANEQINDPERIKQASKIRKKEQSERDRKNREYFDEESEAEKMTCR